MNKFRKAVENLFEGSHRFDSVTVNVTIQNCPAEFKVDLTESYSSRLPATPSNRSFLEDKDDLAGELSKQILTKLTEAYFE